MISEYVLHKGSDYGWHLTTFVTQINFKHSAGFAVYDYIET
jgi:hypothetical protein